MLVLASGEGAKAASLIWERGALSANLRSLKAKTLLDYPSGRSYRMQSCLPSQRSEIERIFS